MRNSLFLTVSLSLSLSCLARTSLAQGTMADRERASFVIGAFITDRETETRLDSGTGFGTELRLEDDLGLESSTTVARLGGHVWFGERNRFDFSVFDFNRSASRPISETIEFGDQVFSVDTVVSTRSELSIIKADYTFAALNRTRGYLGVTGGLYVAQAKLALREPNLGTAESEDLTAPLPVIGLRGEYSITDRVSLRGASQWFDLDVDDASGNLHDLYLGVDYRFASRFNVGLAYNKVTMNITASEDNGFTGRIDWGYDGWLTYLKIDFGR